MSLIQALTNCTNTRRSFRFMQYYSRASKQGKYTDSKPLLCTSVLFYVLILTRCTHDGSLFIVHRSSFIVRCSFQCSLFIHWGGKILQICDQSYIS
ncbi:hypothetical protein M6B38_390890 [Iris pallida]|uniref:Uncharacterized protein n=1 Tax=Iris pallida TaxID=29817 RepID=A0AAX6G059_IRIPA|nr:hypothetical protein M6B38_390890 [Iris pallida]